jgi:hypothetical protein
MTTSRIATAGLAAGLVFGMANTSLALLVGYFPLDDNINPSLATSVADASLNPHNGVMASDGAPPPGVGAVEGIPSANAGLYGTAYNFSSAATDLGYVDIFPPSPGFTFLTRDGALSYAAWIKPAPTQDFPKPTFIGTTGSAYDFRLDPAGSDYTLRLQSGNTDASGLGTTVTIPANVWTHVAVSKDAYVAANLSANVRFYINGVLTESGTVGRAGSGSTSKRLFIGTGALTNEYFNGGIDEVRIYNEALSGVTIAAIARGGDYNGDGQVDGADFVAWRANDGSQAGYDTWRGVFGKSSAGSGSGSVSTAGVPEPSTLALVGLLASLLIIKRCSRMELVFVRHVAADPTL